MAQLRCPLYRKEACVAFTISGYCSSSLWPFRSNLGLPIKSLYTSAHMCRRQLAAMLGEGMQQKSLRVAWLAAARQQSGLRQMSAAAADWAQQRKGRLTLLAWQRAAALQVGYHYHHLHLAILLCDSIHTSRVIFTYKNGQICCLATLKVHGLLL